MSSAFAEAVLSVLRLGWTECYSMLPYGRYSSDVGTRSAAIVDDLMVFICALGSIGYTFRLSDVLYCSRVTARYAHTRSRS